MTTELYVSTQISSPEAHVLAFRRLAARAACTPFGARLLRSHCPRHCLWCCCAPTPAAASGAAQQEGPIHDVAWSPVGDYFVAVAGFMPAKSTLFTHKCVPKFDLGERAAGG